MTDQSQTSENYSRRQPPSNAEIAAETDPIRKNILSGIQRILFGCPKFVPSGANSISQLATESQVGRHHLYQGHKDLRERYEFLRDKSDQPTKQEAELQLVIVKVTAELKRMKELQLRTRAEAEEARLLSRTFARVINLLQAEVHQETLKVERLRRKTNALQKDRSDPPPIMLRDPERTRQDGAGGVA